MTARRKKLARYTGSSLVESAAGLLVLVPVALFLVDLVALILVQTANDALAKHAARAAAEKSDSVSAQQEAQNVVMTFPNSQMLVNPQIVVFTYTNNPVTSEVYVRTQVTCRLPIPVPLVGIGQVNFVAEATEPIVAVLPP